MLGNEYRMPSHRCLFAIIFENSKVREAGGTGGSVALFGFQFNDDFAEVPRALHESIGFFHLIKLEHTVYNRMNFICF